MPIVLAPDIIVDVEPPGIPNLVLAPPVLADVLVQTPATPVIYPAPLVDPAVTVLPTAGPAGPAGPPGPSGGGVAFEFHQVIPQSVWIVFHQFGRYPIAWSLYDTNGQLCDEYIVEHVDVNTCRVSMDVATAGLIRLI
jgi:hypothetical protein